MLRKVLEKLHLSKRSHPETPRQRDPNTAEGRPSNPSTAIEASRTSPNANDASAFPSSGSLQPESTLVMTRSIQREANLGLELLYEPPIGLAPAVDIIFVHGLTGNSYDTWTYGDRNIEVHWPSQLLGVDIPDARILSFGYDADIVGWWGPASNNRIGNHAENLLGKLIRFRKKTDSDDRSMIFVMHSLGGLVVQNALDLSRSSPEAHLRKFESRAVGLVFMGTPHFGSDKAQWAKLCATMLNLVKKTNKSIVQVLGPDSEMLASIQKKFHEILRLRYAKGQPIEITCFYEELSLPVLGTVRDSVLSQYLSLTGFKVVEMKSAILPGYSSYGIHSTHTVRYSFTRRTTRLIALGYDEVRKRQRQRIRGRSRGASAMDN